MTSTSGLLPYSREEREADEAFRRSHRERTLQRRAAAPRGAYNAQPNGASKRRDLRIMGERED